MNRPVLLLGYTGQLGWECHRTLACLGDLVALDYPQIDFARPESLRSLISELNPWVIVNTVGHTVVDRAEEEPELVHQVNTKARLVSWRSKLKSAKRPSSISPLITFLMVPRIPLTPRMICQIHSGFMLRASWMESERSRR